MGLPIPIERSTQRQSAVVYYVALKWWMWVRYMFAIITQKETKVSNRFNLKWNEEIISWVIGKHTSENIKSNRSGSVGCFNQEKKKNVQMDEKKQQIIMERCTECKAKKGTESSHKHRDRMGKRPYSAPRNKLMTDHLSFLMITLRQKIGISPDVLSNPVQFTDSDRPTDQPTALSVPKILFAVCLLACCCIQTFVFVSCQSELFSLLFELY